MLRQPSQVEAAPSDKYRQTRFLALLAGIFIICASFATPGQNPPATPKTRQLTEQTASERPGSSLYTVTADGPLTNYSSSQSGNRFYVTIPEADASRLSGTARGRGYEGVQVLRQGRDTVLVFQLQPGAKAHVNQRANRLDVVFTTPEGLPDGTVYQPDKPAENSPARTPAAAPEVFPLPRQPEPTAAARNNSNPREPVAPVIRNPTNTEHPLAAPSAAAPETEPTVTPESNHDAIVPSEITAPPLVVAHDAARFPRVLAVVLGGIILCLAGFIIRRRYRQSRFKPARAGGVPAEDESLAAVPLAVSGAGNVALAWTPDWDDALADEREQLQLGPATNELFPDGTEAAGAAALIAVEAGNHALRERQASSASLVSTANNRALPKISGEITVTAENEAYSIFDQIGTDVFIMPEIISWEALPAGNAQSQEGHPHHQTSPIGLKPEGTLPFEVVSFLNSQPADAKEEIIDMEAVPTIMPPDPRVEAEVRRLLAGERYDVALMENGSADARQYIAAQLLTAVEGKDFAARERALGAFVAYGFLDDAVAELHEAAAPERRCAAARALGFVRDTAATQPLLEALHDTLPEVRRAAVQALAKIRDPAAVEALTTLLRQEQDRRVPRALIQFALDSCRENSAPRLEMFDLTVPSTNNSPTITADVTSRYGAEEDVLRPPAFMTSDEQLRAEAEKVRARVEAEMRHREEEMRRGVAARMQAEAEARRQAEAEAARWRAEVEERMQRVSADENRHRAEAEARQRTLEEATRQAAAQEAARVAEAEARHQAEAEAARRQAEAARQRLAEETARHQVAEEASLQAESAARRQAEEQLAQLRAELQAQRQAREEAVRRRAALEEARLQAEAEARRQAEEETRLRAEAEDRKRLEEARRQAEAEARQLFEAELARKQAAEEARLQAEAEARRLAEAEAARIRAEAEERLRVETEAARMRAAEEARRQAEMEARMRAEAEAAQQRAEAEAARLRAEAEAARQQAAAEEQRLAEIEVRRQAEAEARLRAEAEARQQLEAELAQLRAEAEAEREQIEAEMASLQVAEEAQRQASVASEAGRLRLAQWEAEAQSWEAAEKDEAVFVMPPLPVATVPVVNPEAEEMRLRLAEEVARRQAVEAETARLRAEAEAAQQEEMAHQRAAEEAAWQRQQEEAARQRAEAEAEQQREAARQHAEAEQQQEAIRQQEIAHQRAEAEAAQREEAARIYAAAEAAQQQESARLAEENEAARRWAEVHAAQEQTAASDLVIEMPATPVYEEKWDSYENGFAFTPSPVPAVTEEAPDSFAFVAEALPPVAAPPVAVEPTPVITLRQAPAAAANNESGIPPQLLADLQNGNTEVRAAAALSLARLEVEGDEAFAAICQVFDDPIQSVRDAASRALYNLTRDRAATFTRALREATPDRRRSIGASMSSSGLADEAISNLVDESREKTYDAFSFLFLMSKAGEVQPLLRAIKDHPSKDVRLAVVRLLALSGQPEVLPAFRRLAVRGSLPTEVRSAVMEAIFQISSQHATEASSQIN